MREASDRECELKKQELDFKKKQEENTAAQETLMASTSEESPRPISSNVSYDGATTANLKPGPAFEKGKLT